MIYKVTDNFPKKERYFLSNQMRRSSSSITSNIAEGFGRKTYKEKLHFYYQAQGSLIELKNQILIAKDIGYLEGKALKNTAQKIKKTHSLLRGLIRKTRALIRKS